MRLKPKRTAAIAAAAAALAGAPEARAASCPNVPGGDAISTTNTTCREAHKLVRMWLEGVRRDGRYDRRVVRWTCCNRPDPYEGGVIHCRKDAKKQRVVWYANVPRG